MDADRTAERAPRPNEPVLAQPIKPETLAFALKLQNCLRQLGLRNREIPGSMLRIAPE